MARPLTDAGRTFGSDGLSFKFIKFEPLNGFTTNDRKNFLKEHNRWRGMDVKI